MLMFSNFIIFFLTQIIYHEKLVMSLIIKEFIIKLKLFNNNKRRNKFKKLYVKFKMCNNYTPRSTKFLHSTNYRPSCHTVYRSNLHGKININADP